MVLDLALPKKPGLEDPTNTVVAPSFPEQMPRIVLDRQNKMRHAQTRVVHVHALLTRGSYGWRDGRPRGSADEESREQETFLQSSSRGVTIFQF